jgi:hypothetical protein
VSAVEEFERLEGVLAGAQARLREAHERRRDRPAALEQAEAALHEHIAAVHAGEAEPDPETEDRLHQAARDAGEAVSVRLVNYGQTSEAQLVDLVAEGRVVGAARAVELAEAELRAFAGARLTELAVELAKGPSAEVGREAVAALSVARRAGARWNEVYGRWATVMRWAGRADLLASAPENPFDLKPIDVDALQLGPTPGALF